MSGRYIAQSFETREACPQCGSETYHVTTVTRESVKAKAVRYTCAGCWRIAVHAYDENGEILFSEYTKGTGKPMEF